MLNKLSTFCRAVGRALVPARNAKTLALTGPPPSTKTYGEAAIGTMDEYGPEVLALAATDQLMPVAAPTTAETKAPLTAFSRIRAGNAVTNRPMPPRPQTYKPANR